MRLVLYSALIAIASAFACGSSSNATDESGSSSSGSFNIGDGGSGGSCSAAAQLVYVVSAQDDLYSFQPDAKKFSKIGRLSCAAGTATPNSMAIDRSGVAWVNYTDGTLYKVSTADASCERTTFAPNQAGFLKFGMAFATNGPKSTKETLYIVGLGSKATIGEGFGVIDLDSMKLSMLGDFSGALAGHGAELTGTGDGKLYGFFATDGNAMFAEINGTNGATPSPITLDRVSTGESWAFSFWGGDFWFYTSPDEATPSTVTRFEKSTNDDLGVSIDDVGGFRIVGAGVSTCAPLVPPK